MLIIYKNNFNINEYHSDMDLTHLVKNIEFGDNLLESIMDQLHIHGTSFDTTTCLETEEYIYQICHVVNHEREEEYVKDNINYLASFLTPKDEIMTHDVCLMKFSNREDMRVVPITYNDLHDIINRKILHTGLIIKSSGLINNFEYLNVKYANKYYSDKKELEVFVKDYFHLDESSDTTDVRLLCDDISIAGYVCELFFYKSAELSGKENKDASLLYGKKIYGDCVMIVKASDGLYGNINRDELNNLLMIIKKGVSDEQINELMNKDKPEFNNRFLLMKRILKKL